MTRTPTLWLLNAIDVFKACPHTSPCPAYGADSTSPCDVMWMSQIVQLPPLSSPRRYERSSQSRRSYTLPIVALVTLVTTTRTALLMPNAIRPPTTAPSATNRASQRHLALKRPLQQRRRPCRLLPVTPTGSHTIRQ